MARLPIFIGSFLFGISIFVCAVAVLLVNVLDSTIGPEGYGTIFLWGALIYISGIVAGVGVGFAIAGEEEYKKANTALGAIGLAGIVAFSFWFMMLSTSYNDFPLMGIIASLVAAVIAFIGLWIAIVGRSNE
ncbi:MAG: hypothetical protein ACFFD4_00685 [Candidatus Odinarchaeota archaeon]